MYASFGKRTIAFILDTIFYSVFISILSQLSGLIPARMMHYNMFLPWIMIVVAVMSWLGWLIGFLCYYAWAESSPWQATLGKKIMGIKVTDINGERISFSRSFCRQMGIPLSFLPLGIGIFKYWSNQKKQCWHDKITDCLVVEKDYMPELEPQVLPPVSKGLKMFFYFLCLIPLVCWLALGIVWKQTFPQLQQLLQQNPEKTQIHVKWSPSTGLEEVVPADKTDRKLSAAALKNQQTYAPSAPTANNQPNQKQAILQEIKMVAYAVQQLNKAVQYQAAFLSQHGISAGDWRELSSFRPDKRYCLVNNTDQIPFCQSTDLFALVLGPQFVHAYRINQPDGIYYSINANNFRTLTFSCIPYSEPGKEFCRQWQMAGQL